MKEKMPRGKNINSSRANLHHLPEDILIQILVRLPVKCLLRFRSICKSWYFLIPNPNFIEAHLTHQTNNTNLLLLIKYESVFRDNFCYSIRYDDESFCCYSPRYGDESSGEYFDPKLPLPLKSLWMYGSCNGLVCLSENPFRPSCSIFLWNPALRKLKTLPKPEIPFSAYKISMAFGFHSQVNDYKVVRIVFLRLGMDNSYKTSFLIDVYSLRTDAWRRIGVLSPSCSITAGTNVFMNGAAYWTATGKTASGVSGYTLMRFDMGIEVFEEVMLPDSAQQSFPCIFGLGELLYVFSFDQKHRCHIWTMESSKMGSWTKQFTVDFHDGQLFGLRRNGELLKINDNNKPLSYNLEIQKSKYLGINTYPMNSCAHSYVESLVPVDGRGDSFFTW